MANPHPHKFEGSQLGAVQIELEFTTTTAGAVLAITKGGSYVKSVAQTGGTGHYLVTMFEFWNKLFNPTFKVVQATYDATHARGGDLIVDNISNTTTPTLEFIASNSAGAPTNITSGDVGKITIPASYIAY